MACPACNAPDDLAGAARLLIEAECTRLVGAYGFLTDRRRYDEQIALFTDDGVYENPFHKTEGKQQLRAYLDSKPTNIATRHMCGQTFFDKVEADTASAVTYVSVFLGEGPDEGPVEVPNPGGLVEFHNIFRRTPGGWRIAFHASKGVMSVKK